ncbi:MAG: hypothetical protein ACXVLQ_11655 [Bacteriovorax sp.]
MIDKTKKASDYSKSNKSSQGKIYGGKIHQREQDVRDILDNQIAGASNVEIRRQGASKK